jgi:hypothetical protein
MAPEHSASAAAVKLRCDPGTRFALYRGDSAQNGIGQDTPFITMTRMSLSKRRERT